MKPTKSVFLLALLIDLPVHTVLIHWFWSSWAASLVGVPLPWLNAFIIAFFTAGFYQGVVYLGRIADMMHEEKEQRTLQRQKVEESKWDSPLA